MADTQAQDTQAKGKEADWSKELGNLYHVCMAAAEIKGKDVCLLMGETGIGKSALACAIAVGAKNMTTFKQTYTGKSGKTRSRVVVKVKDDVKVAFKIGHERVSETVYPNLYQMIEKDGTAGLWICDCPGFNDSKGNNQELTNCLTIHQILSQAKAIRIIIAFQPSQLRGNEVRDSIDSLIKFFKKSSQYFVYAKTSIIPVILRAHITTEVDEVLDDVFESLNAGTADLKEAANIIYEKGCAVDPLDRGNESFTTVAELWSNVKGLTGIPHSEFQPGLTDLARTRLNMVTEGVADYYGKILSVNDPEARRIISTLKRHVKYLAGILPEMKQLEKRMLVLENHHQKMEKMYNEIQQMAGQLERQKKKMQEEMKHMKGKLLEEKKKQEKELLRQIAENKREFERMKREREEAGSLNWFKRVGKVLYLDKLFGYH